MNTNGVWKETSLFSQMSVLNTTDSVAPLLYWTNGKILGSLRYFKKTKLALNANNKLTS